jgi:hypothetical protein
VKVHIEIERTAYLRAAHRAGSLKVSDAALAANQYLSLFLGLGQVSALLGLALATKREDEEMLSANVELVLRALGRPAKPVSVARSGTRKT